MTYQQYTQSDAGARASPAVHFTNSTLSQNHLATISDWTQRERSTGECEAEQRNLCLLSALAVSEVGVTTLNHNLEQTSLLL